MSLLKDIKTHISKGFRSFALQNKSLILQKQFWDFWAIQKKWATIFKGILTSRCSKNDWQPWNFIFAAELEGFPSMVSRTEMRMCPSTQRGNAKPSPQASLTWWGGRCPNAQNMSSMKLQRFLQHISTMQRSGTRCFIVLLWKLY